MVVQIIQRNTPRLVTETLGCGRSDPDDTHTTGLLFFRSGRKDWSETS